MHLKGVYEASRRRAVTGNGRSREEDKEAHSSWGRTWPQGREQQLPVFCPRPSGKARAPARKEKLPGPLMIKLKVAEASTAIYRSVIIRSSVLK